MFDSAATGALTDFVCIYAKKKIVMARTTHCADPDITYISCIAVSTAAETNLALR